MIIVACIVSTARTGEVPSPKHAKSTIGIAVGWSEISDMV